MVRPDALGAHVLGIARLLDEANVEGMGVRVELGEVALALLPVLEAGSDEVDLVAGSDQGLGKKDVARGALDLLAELGVDAENGDALLIHVLPFRTRGYLPSAARILSRRS